MRRVRVMEADLSFAARLKHNPHMHQEALIRSDAQRLMMKLSTYGPVPDVAISTCGSAPQAARTALSQDIAAAATAATAAAAPPLPPRM